MAIADLNDSAVRFGVKKVFALSAASMFALTLAPGFVADAQTKAPISFGQAQSSPNAQYQQYASAPMSSTQMHGSSRIEYRYPDQPNMSYGAQGPRQLEQGAQPIAFSSSTSAITMAQAQKISGSSFIPPRDPALTKGAFDAKAAALNAAHKVGQSSRQLANNLSQTLKPRPQAHPSQTNVSVANEPPPGFAKQKIGAPYEIQGRWYVPFAEANYDEVGIGSWYGPTFHGKASATGEIFDENALTAAHPTLPIPSLARITNVENGRTVVVRINDRGPFVDDRIIDMSKYAASVLGYKNGGTAMVRVQYMGFAPEEHNTVPAIYVAEAQRTLALSNSAKPTTPTLTKVNYKPNNSPPKQPRQAKALPQLPQHQFNSSPPDNANFMVQVGVFGELSNAHQMRAKLHSFGDVSLQEVRISDRDMFKVFVGARLSREEADRTKANLNASGFNALIVAN